MKPVKFIETFHDRYPLLGPLFWMLSVQYYLIQVIVAAAWTSPAYNWLSNTISDLGSTACAPAADRPVCSPLHSLMNASFIVLGFSMVIGAALIYHEFKRSRVHAIGFSLMALAGVGTVLVGLFPENTVVWLHVLGAFLPFFIGNLGLVVLGLSLDLPTHLRLYTIISGLVSLIALSFFISQLYFGLDIGGMERIVAYPQTVWLIVFGLYISRNHRRHL